MPLHPDSLERSNITWDQDFVPLRDTTKFSELKNYEGTKGSWAELENTQSLGHNHPYTHILQPRALQISHEKCS